MSYFWVSCGKRKKDRLAREDRTTISQRIAATGEKCGHREPNAAVGEISLLLRGESHPQKKGVYISPTKTEKEKRRILRAKPITMRRARERWE